MGSSGMVPQMEEAGLSVCLFIQLNGRVEFIVYHRTRSQCKYWMTKEIKRKEKDMIAPSFCGRQTLIQMKEKAQMQRHLGEFRVDITQLSWATWGKGSEKEEGREEREDQVQQP